MNLDETQRKTVAAWIGSGLKLSEIQSRLASELGLRLTYMDVRFLVDDLKLTPKDAERPQPSTSALGQTGMPAAQPGGVKGAKAGAAPPISPVPDEPATRPGGIALSVDQIARPGAVISGKVTFSDGKKAEWYLDETGRLGLAPEQQGYRPPASEIQQFQAALEQELSKLGL